MNKSEIIKIYFITFKSHYIDHDFSINVFDNQRIKRIIHDFFIYSKLNQFKNIQKLLKIFFSQ